MADLFENPMGLMGFEFVEFCHPNPAELDRLFTQMGFTAVAKHRSKQVTLYRQGGINLILNAEPGSFAANFAAAHGPSAPAMAFRVVDAQYAYERALKIGEAAYGRDHATISTIVYSLGLVLKDLGDLAGARAAGRRWPWAPPE